jgi:hypothetical protein
MDLYVTLILIFSVDIDAVLTAGAIAFSRPRTRVFTRSFTTVRFKIGRVANSLASSRPPDVDWPKAYVHRQSAVVGCATDVRYFASSRVLQDLMHLMA